MKECIYCDNKAKHFVVGNGYYYGTTPLCCECFDHSQAWSEECEEASA